MVYTKRLYNIMAFALKKVTDITNERDFERLRTVNENYEIRIIEGLKEKFSDMFDKDTRNVSNISEWGLEDSALVFELENYLNSAEDKDELIFLVEKLDSFLENTYFECFPIDQEEYRFLCLNDNYSECGLYLLPRVVCGWEHQNRDAYTSYTVFYYLRNFYFIFQEDMADFQVENILMPKDLFWDAVWRSELRIMVSPVTGIKAVETTKPYTKNGSQFTSVQSMERDIEEKIEGKVLKIIKRAVCEEIDILVFPEMLGSEGIAGSIATELRERKDILNNEFPALTMCPTIWRNHINFCRILDDMGEVICEQQKHYGVDLKDEIWKKEEEKSKEDNSQCHFVKEDITSDQKVYVLHCHGIGRIAVAICKDFLMTAYLKILVEKLRVSLLFVPSFTCNDYQFELLTSKYAELDCNVIWINACSARWLDKKGKMAAYVTRAFLPGRRGVDEQRKGMDDFCENQCRCEEECIHTYRIRLDMEEKV